MQSSLMLDPLLIQAEQSATSADVQDQQHPSDLLLPEPVLISILQQVPLKQRLTSCALVCRAWAAAAALSSTAVAVTATKARTCVRLQAWLQGCGGEVTSITLSSNLSSSSTVLQLPCSQLTRLQSLTLIGATVLLQVMPSSSNNSSMKTRSRSRIDGSSSSCALSFRGSSSSTAANTPSGSGLLPCLQHLRLCCCRMPVQDFKQLSQLTSLTSLSLAALRLSTDRIFSSNVDTAKACAAVYALLQHLPTSLSVLQLHRHRLAALPQLAPLSAMQHLQRLDLQWCGPRDSLAGLPSSLTALLLHHVGCNTQADFPHSRGLSEARSSLQQLQRRLQQGFSIYEENDGAYAGGADDARRQALLEAVGRLTQLQHLEFSQPYQRGIAPDPSCFTALTASSQLTALQVQAATYGSTGFMPAQALQHMLPPGKQLPHLRQLKLINCFSNGTGGVDAADISRIAACCPALQQLELVGVISCADAVSSLAQLQPCLTALVVGGVALNDPAAVAAVVQLTSLKSLTWASHLCSALPLAGVQQLTAVHGLTKLVLHGWTICPVGGRLVHSLDEPPLVLTNKYQDQRHPDVHLQLRLLVGWSIPDTLRFDG